MTKPTTAMLAASVLAITAFAAAGTSAAAPAQRPTAQKNIVQTAIAAGQFKTLVMLAKRAGLAGALTGQTKLTVFAPTDAAFKMVPKATLNKLLRNRAQLRRVLLYHVVAGDVKAAQVVELRSAKTLAGPSVRIRHPRRERLPQRFHPGSEDRHRGVERHDSRHQQGSPPACAVEPRSPVSGNGRPPGRPLASQVGAGAGRSRPPGGRLKGGTRRCCGRT